MRMSVSPLDRIAAPFADLAKHDNVQAGREALAAGRGFWPHLTVLTAFWIYVALSNVLYAHSMQASLSSMKIEHVFAAWDARLLQHLLLYPLFLLGLWRSARTRNAQHEGLAAAGVYGRGGVAWGPAAPAAERGGAEVLAAVRRVEVRAAVLGLAGEALRGAANNRGAGPGGHSAGLGGEPDPGEA